MDIENRIYTQIDRGEKWLQRYQGRLPIFACVLGFTETGLIPGISAAGKTPEDRRFTAIADAEFLVNGVRPHPRYPLPPLAAGASPVLISRAVVETLGIPVDLFNAGLPQPPPVEAIDLGGVAAACVTTGKALSPETAAHLLQQGMEWGEKLAAQAEYLILGECVVGGTTTALAVLAGLGFAAAGKVNSSHPQCNHAQKWTVVRQGLQAGGFWGTEKGSIDPLSLVAAVGDPMQIAVAGMAIAASRRAGVLLAGGTQMLAVYALIRAIARQFNWDWNADNVVVGTTRWVAEDPTGDTCGLAAEIGDVPLLATPLSFAKSRFESLRAYERGYVKEGVGAGGCAIAASLYRGWNSSQLLEAIERLVDRL
ncbi:MAG TPA: TIGR00303 family protein [Oscillatoriales cyanobacterium M59_W2019_021]|nr:MAG: TIGR00303 family protein [Cyanobacteria bacterium J055]HIK30445.1 TIGR00303 family protein [Oscillatoriales cyanobacterium M4454_W2019_049]HIK52062.1 TIGR00303 family protein [Oscillatoriales cyanobacterium M59_W2019_021]